MKVPRTKIEIVDPLTEPESSYLVKPKEVRVNGVPVLVAEGGISIEYDQKDEPVRVILELLPDEVIFRRASPVD